jgi:hypothetical protein
VPARRPTTDGKLSELARHVVLPAGIATTGWPAVRDKCDEFAVRFDGWQDGLGRAILAKREGGQYAAGIGGVVISIARQVGKTFLIGMMIVALCVLFPGLKVVWTAHRTRTSDETFKSLQGVVKRKRIAPHVLTVRQANGQQEISFLNGSRILFGARESGFGRGFDDVDVLVFDEAQILTSKALDDMVPATNVAENPLILMMGTPPKPTDPSEAFTERRREALSGDADDMLFVEFSAERDADLDDRAQWRKGNPSYPHRTPEAAMLRMKRQLGDESFRREGLGIWDSDSAARWSVVSAGAWADRAVAESPPGVVAYGVDMSPDRAWLAISVAVKPDDGGPVHVEVACHESGRKGTEWAVLWLAERWRNAAAVVVDAQSPAASLVPALAAKHVAVTVTTAGDMSKACGMFVDGVRDKGLTHFGQPALTDALAGATKRNIGLAGGWGWDRRDPSVDISPLVAATVALFGVQTSKRRPGRRARAVVLT